MKSILTLALAFFTFSVFSQEKTTFYKDGNLKTKVEESEANVKLIEKRDDSSIFFELYNLKTNCLIRTEQYDTNFVPKGVWESYDKECELEKVRDFSVLKYLNKSDAIVFFKSKNVEVDYERIVWPEYKTGDKELFKYLSNTIEYPKVSANNGSEGRVIVSFVIDVDGSISDMVILEGVDPYIDLEAYRVVSEMPKWKPATKDGEPVKLQYNLPISFTLR